MSNELVKRLKFTLDNFGVRLPLADCQAIDEAIAFISSHDSVRDRVLEEAVQAVVHCNTSKIGAASAIRALKAKPFTRTDGTTSPERGTVEDRRKSAYGNATEGVRRGYDYSKLGRRSGDRARWTGEAAPVVECDTGSESMIEAEQPGYKYAVHLLKAIASKHFGDGPKVKPLPSIDGVLTQIDHLTASMVRERPTQEAPQPEKPGLVDWYRDRFSFIYQDSVSHARLLDVLAEIGARQGEK